MELGFTDRHVVVTGGTGALGSAVVGLLVEAGARCSVPVRDLAELERFTLRGDSRVLVREGVELADEGSVGAFFGDAVDVHGGLWASVHVAGGFAMSPLRETDGRGFMHQIEMNALTCFLCCREAVTRMGPGGGRIVNVAARPALEARAGSGMVAYTASKAAVAALTQALAEEVAGEGILVNAVVPSTIDTPANRRSMPGADFSAWPKVEEVAATILYLASAANRCTRGGLVPVYGRS
jgi:NAD(P)-dependent dehydrogenase (short-subunit alcohol dehydrogenase family)